LTIAFRIEECGDAIASPARGEKQRWSVTGKAVSGEASRDEERAVELLRLGVEIQPCEVDTVKETAAGAMEG
jgi:hypothetical protein